MMKQNGPRTVLIACEVIRDELQVACDRTGCNYHTIWMDSALHMFPEKMHESLQKTLDELEGYERVLLSMGYCGNAVAELKTRGFSLILPKADDCVSIMCGSADRRQQLSEGHNCIFLTRGWLNGSSGIVREYEHIKEKHGKETADMVMSMMYEHYDRLAVIDTGAFDLKAVLPEAERIAKKLDLEQKVIPGTVDLLAELLMGPWPEERFLVIEPYSKVSSVDLKC